jgi:exopolyphosphatase/guanosine-5'-triphosphate,3'-diphosphate pyrophosphatase
MNYGIVDIGSNTIRIVVYDVRERRFECLYNEKQFVQLITYVKNGRMQDEGMRSMISALRQLTRLVFHYHCKEIRCFATAPFRAVEDTAHLKDIIHNFTGLEVETLSGEEEARLGLIGASYQTGANSGLFVDLGGGSMEISLMKDHRILHASSIPLGCVNISSRFVSGLMPTEKELKKIKHCAGEAIAAFPWLEEAQGMDMYCIGGTARALGQIRKTLLGSGTQNEVYTMEARDIKHVYQNLIELKLEGVRLMSRVCPARIFTFIPGAVMLRRVAKAAGIEKVHLNTYGVREGYLIRRIIEADAAEDAGLTRAALVQ